MKYLVLCLLLLSGTVALSQKVGLVLSGGAAKGIAHVGVLKALEENEIPIDYIVGTSMGGIIGGCYAAGMSPDQIEQIVLSDEFLRWINGLPETGYNYYYHKSADNPGFLRVNLSLDSTFNMQFNSTLANDVSLNFALADKMAQATAIANNNFDSLFVPLRVVAADIFTQREVILDSGQLSDALRATQTVPFFYNPIRVDGRYLFDGGVYNNFPVDVLQETFSPDVVIGVNVSSKVFNEYPYDDDDKLISRSLLYLLLDKSDPAMIPDSGVYIQPDLQGYTSFDFAEAKSLIDSGYAQTVRQMDEIKSKTRDRVTCDDVALKRNIFNNKSYPFIFEEISFKGFNSKQRHYIRKVFGIKQEKPQMFYYSDIKKGYFKLVSEEYFNNVYPNILFDRQKNSFSLQLSRRPQKNFQFDFGGVISSRDISSMYLGLNYYHFDKSLVHAYASFQTGSFYKSAEAKVRMDYPSFYLQPSITFNTWDYLENEDFFQERKSTVLKRINRQLSLMVGWPISKRFKSELCLEGISNNDQYSNSNLFVSTDTLDVLKLKGVKTGIKISMNTLDRKQYASSGKAFRVSAYYYNVQENFTPGNTSMETQPVKTYHQWFRFNLHAEQYFSYSRYKFGYVLETTLSNQPFFQNYMGTIVNSPAFLPFQDSPTLLLQNFRSFNYIAGGVRNVFSLRSKLDFRIEGYAFKPIDYLYQDDTQEAKKGTALHSVYLAATAGLVLHSPIGPVSLSCNYYDDEENRLGVLLHVGFLLYKKHPLE